MSGCNEYANQCSIVSVGQGSAYFVLITDKDGLVALGNGDVSDLVQYGHPTVQSTLANPLKASDKMDGLFYFLPIDVIRCR